MVNRTSYASLLLASILLFAITTFACAKGEESSSSNEGASEKEAGTPTELEGGIQTSDASQDTLDPRTGEFHAAADAAFETYFRTYWTGSTIRDDRTNSKTAGYWGYAQAFDVVLDAVERTGRYKGLIETMYAGKNTSAEGWLVGFFDDENWMALALMRAFDLTGQAAYLAKAEEIYNDIATNAPDTTCCGPNPGGIWWDKAHTSKATASNLGAVIVAARLAQRTGKDHLLFAKQVYDYWMTHMVDPKTNQVLDHINNGDSAPTPWKFTYNEGLAIGASLELYRSTKDTSYLNNAHKFAAFMVKEETADGEFGRVLSDGADSETIECNDGMMFKGIGFRYLAQLQATSPKPEYQAVLDASAMGALKTARTSDTFFSFDWAKKPTQANPCMMAQNSGLMALSRFASLLGPNPKPADPNAWEAEEAVLRGVGLEAAQPGYEGWGYLAGWNSDGQWVDFKASVPPGNYTLHFRFAAGAGDAKRLIYINGKEVVDAQLFSSTGAWNVYETVNVRAQLLKDNTISVIYNSSKGSTNFLNLDRMTMTKAP